MDRFCNNCKSKLDSMTGMCPNCGNGNDNKNKKLIILLVLAIICAIAVISVFAAVVITDISAKNKEEETQPATTAVTEQVTEEIQEKDKDEAKKDDKDTNTSDEDMKAFDKKDNADDKTKSDDTDDKKKFSLDCYADEGALMSMLEGETEENQALCKGLFAKKDLNVIMSKLLAIKKENDEFKKNAQECEAKECSKDFSACMGEVKGDIDEKTYSELYAEGKDIKTKDEMCKFTQKVKAFAYDHKKTIDNDSKNDDVFRFSEPKKTVSDDDTDVFARLNKKYN